MPLGIGIFLTEEFWTLQIVLSTDRSTAHFSRGRHRECYWEIAPFHYSWNIDRFTWFHIPFFFFGIYRINSQSIDNLQNKWWDACYLKTKQKRMKEQRERKKIFEKTVGIGTWYISIWFCRWKKKFVCTCYVVDEKTTTTRSHFHVSFEFVNWSLWCDNHEIAAAIENNAHCTPIPENFMKIYSLFFGGIACVTFGSVKWKTIASKLIEADVFETRKYRTQT